MIHIRQSQIQALANDRLSRFVRALADDLQPRFNTSADNEEVFFARVEHAIVVSQQFGFITEEQISRFAEFVLLFGTDLLDATKLPWLTGTLSAQHLSPAEKLDRLDSHYTFSYAAAP